MNHRASPQAKLSPYRFHRQTKLEFPFTSLAGNVWLVRERIQLAVLIKSDVCWGIEFMLLESPPEYTVKGSEETLQRADPARS